MYMHEIAMKTFVVLQADRPADQARGLIERLAPTHVIVHRNQPKNRYYLFHLFLPSETLSALARVPPQTSVHDALDLRDDKATPVLGAYASAESAPDRCVVVEEGDIIGFFDVTALVAGSVRRGTDEFTTKSGEFLPRSLVADFPEQVPLHSTTSLLVSLSAASMAGGLPMALQSGATVDVVVQPRRGLSLEGSGEGSLVVSDEETLPLQFKLKAIALGPGSVRVLAFHRGQPLGTLTLAPEVVPATGAVSSSRRSHEQPVASISVYQPDLSLLILEHEAHGDPLLTFRLTAADPGLELNLKRFGPIRLRMSPPQYFQEFFVDIEDLPLRTPRDMAVAEQRLAAKGAALFETLLPPDLQALLWSMRDRIRFVQVQSEEAWIPWELCKLQGREDGRVVEGPFLCEAFAMTRWLPEVGFKPTLSLKNVALVVPGDSHLRFAISERDHLLSLAGGGRRVVPVPATFLDLRSALASGTYDGWHFTGHGGFRASDPNRSTIQLEGQEPLTPDDLSGMVANLGLARPLVFLNACQIGRGGMSLTDIGGWAAKFLRAGAGAFIGAYWSIYDRAAHDFARHFYDNLLAGMTIGEAVQAARIAIKPLGNPTWLAYTVFADPLARVQ